MFAVIDIETTGGNMQTDRITEIAIIVHNGQRIIEEYSTLINPLRPIQPFVMALTGISNEMVQDAPTFEEVVDRIHLLTENRIFVAHNVNFDYGFLKSEFKRAGKTFRRKTLCTIHTSKKVFPNKRSYGLGNICKELEIEIHDRHRAHGDASATAILLEKLLFNDKKKIIKDLLKGELATTHLPSNIAESLVDELPEETGVYYFLNEKGQIIYVGKSKNIRERVISHFRNDSNSSAALKMKEQIHDITYEVTCNELIALLKESDEIKRWMPEFNKSQRRQKYRYGLYSEFDQDGYYNFKIDLLHPSRNPIRKFRSKVRAEKFLEMLMTKNDIGLSYKKIYDADYYNERVDVALSKYVYPHESFLIIEHGRMDDEKVVILIENNEYKGYGFFNPLFTGNNLETIKECVVDYRDNPDVQRILLAYLKKNKKQSNILPL
ncbi:MAG: exonuclease domain-containing protein [Chitinophagales bacterium]